MILIIHTVFSHSPSGFFFSIWLSQIQVIFSTGCLVGGLRSEMGLVWWCCWETKPWWRIWLLRMLMNFIVLCFKLRTEMVVVTTTYDWKKEFQYLDWLFTTSIFRLSTFQSLTKEEGGDESNLGLVNGWRGRRWMVLESNLGLMSLGIWGWREKRNK